MSVLCSVLYVILYWRLDQLSSSLSFRWKTNAQFRCRASSMSTDRRTVMRRLITPFLVIFLLLLASCGGGGGGGGGGSSGGNNAGGQQGLTGATSYNKCPSSTNTSVAAADSGTVTLTVSGATSSPAEDALVQS